MKEKVGVQPCGRWSWAFPPGMTDGEGQSHPALLCAVHWLQARGSPVLPCLAPVPELEEWKQVTEHIKDAAQALSGQHWRPQEGAE